MKVKPVIPCCAALAALLTGSLAGAKQTPRAVNFVVICLDDMGNGDLNITGATGYRTPNLDRLARERSDNLSRESGGKGRVKGK